jgi:hypothetical protein
MKYNSELNSTDGVCTVHVTGKFRRPEDSDELKRVAVDFFTEHGIRLFLIDLRQAEVTGGTMSMFEAANPKGVLAESLREVKTAFVGGKLSEDDRFYENVAVNQGYQLWEFETLNQAVEWLTMK